MSCIFCKIASGEIPATVAHRDEDVVAVVDSNPQAPEHLLVMPVKHYDNIADLAASNDDALMAKLFDIAAQLGREQSASGFRLVVNTGPDGGQTVDHMHVHVLAGRPMTWPPG
ncbi:MAG: HIT domain-containing protein [Candidatus Eremiobacteraeota bacterium]|nr:HIT domain-containing protein [Candidatus Eremiobacteraeota bacterium]